MHKAVECPKCGKTLIFHVEGNNATYQIKCRNKECREIVMIYSAGKTALWDGVEREKGFDQVDKMMRHNRYVDATKIS